MEIRTEAELKKACGLLERAEPDAAKRILETLFEYEFDSPELVFTADCCNFWAPHMRGIERMESPFEKGESLLATWKTFCGFVARKKIRYAPALEATERGVFSRALENYQTLLDGRDEGQKAEALRKAGLCCKKLGKFADAERYLAAANKQMPGAAAVLAELADCCALCGKERNAKVLFREAFFIDPERIDMAFLDSELVRGIIDRLEAQGFAGEELRQWVPVYGVLWGIFNVKRELKAQEAAKLRQEIYAVENELKDPASNAKILTPRLINLYFWLIDHYVTSNGSVRQVNDILLKIRILDPAIYELYTK